MHVIAGPPIQRYLIRYAQYRFRYDTDLIIVLSLNATTQNVQAVAAADITARWLLFITNGVLPCTFMMPGRSGAHFTVWVPTRQLGNHSKFDFETLPCTNCPVPRLTLLLALSRIASAVAEH